MYKSTNQFLKTGLPTLLARTRAPLQCIFTSDKEVGDYDSGSVDTGSNDLSIEVQNGNYFLNIHDLWLLGAILQQRLPGSMAVTKSKQLTNEALEAQQRVCKNVDSVQVEPGRSIFVCMDLGLLAFQEALDCATRVKGNYPQAEVIVLTCNCDMKKKMEVLDQYVQNGEITDYVVTDDCSGKIAIGQILEAVMEQWLRIMAT